VSSPYRYRPARTPLRRCTATGPPARGVPTVGEDTTKASSPTRRRPSTRARRLARDDDTWREPPLEGLRPRMSAGRLLAPGRGTRLPDPKVSGIVSVAAASHVEPCVADPVTVAGPHRH
jgi:hypothetical protein